MKLYKVLCKLSAALLFALPLVANSTIITIDNTDAGFSSSGLRTSVANCCVGSAIGDYYMVDQVGSQGDYAIWDPTDHEDWLAGIWKVEMNWTSYVNRSKNVLVTIDAGINSLFVNQRYNGGQWIDLGTYTFGQTSASVKIDDSHSNYKSYFVADAVRFTLLTESAAASPAVAQVPAPSGLALFALSGLALIGFRRPK